MKLNIITPFNKISKDAVWVEIDTTCGNFVIEDEHAPMVLILQSNSNVVVCLDSGKQEKFKMLSGVAHIKRDLVNIIGDL